MRIKQTGLFYCGINQAVCSRTQQPYPQTIQLVLEFIRYPCLIPTRLYPQLQDLGACNGTQ